MKKTEEQQINAELIKNPNEVELETPIKRGEQLITKIVINKPNVGTLRGLSLQEILNLDVNSMVTLLTRITQPPLTEIEINQMEVPDFTSLNIKVTDFLATAQAKSHVASMT